MASYTKAAQVSAALSPSGQAVPGRPLPPRAGGGGRRGAERGREGGR